VGIATVLSLLLSARALTVRPRSRPVVALERASARRRKRP